MLDQRPRVAEALRGPRRALASRSPRAFARAYLPHHFKVRGSPLHEELFSLLGEATRKRGARIAVAAPRGHAKTTVVSLAYVLWSVLFDHEPFVLIVSATRDQAVAMLRTVRDELQANPALREDFPHLGVPKPASTPWRANQITLANGATIRAAGAGQAIRGAKRGANRPTLIVVDDLEDQEHTESAEQRAKLRDWFERTLLKAGEPRTNVVVVGTILHYDALLATLTHPSKTAGRGAGWTSRVFKAVDRFSDRTDLWERWESILFGDREHEGEVGGTAAKAFYEDNKREMLAGTSVLWPQRESYYDLMWMRATEGRASFQAEKQNEPLDPDECLFREDRIRFWDDPRDPEFEDAEDLVSRLGSRLRFYGACDPSLGRRGGRGDYTAIVTVAKDTRTDRLYVIGADIARRTPEATVERIVQLAQIYDYSEFAVESNQFQQLLVEQVERRMREVGTYVSIEPVNHVTNKLARIQSLEPWITHGRLRLSRRDGMLLEQLRQFPLGAHDDGPDALEMAVTSAVDPRRDFEVIQI